MFQIVEAGQYPLTGKLRLKLYMNQTVRHYLAGEIELALETGKKSVLLAEQHAPELLAKAYNNLGSMYLEIGRVVLALNHYQKAIKENKQEGYLVPSVNAAQCYMMLQNYGRATFIYKELIAHLQRKEQPDTVLLYTTKKHLLNAYMKLNKLAKAKEALSEIEQIANKNISDEYFINFSKGRLAYLEKDYREAKKYFKVTQKTVNNSPEDETSLESKYLLATILKHENKLEEALLLAEKLANIEVTFSVLSIKLKALLLIADIHAKRGDFKQALQYKEKAYNLNDSIKDSNINSQVVQYTEQLNLDRKEKEIALLAEQKKTLSQARKRAQAEAKVSQQRLLLISLIAFLLVLALFAFWYFHRFRIKANQALQKEAEARWLARLEEEVQHRKSSVLEESLKVQKAERDNIATMLHDSLGGLLSTVKLLVSEFDPNGQTTKERQEQLYPKVLGSLEEALEEVRNKSHRLHSFRLKSEGLEHSIQEIVQTLQEGLNIRIDFDYISTEDEIDFDLTYQIYLWCQELLNNMSKYSKANEVYLEVHISISQLSLFYSDNGQGMGTEDQELIWAKPSGLGLRGIFERVANYEGTYRLETEKGKGFSLSLDIPLRKNEGTFRKAQHIEKQA